jgi:transposase
LLAIILEAKFGQHLPLNRQSETFAHEGIELNVSTLADWAGACSAALAPLVAKLETWMRAKCCKLSRHSEMAKGVDYMLKRWPAFTRFLDDGRICLTSNAAERALRGIAIGRKAWLLASSDRGCERAAAIYTLIVTAKLNGLDPRAWLADVLCRTADHPASRLDELLPWNCTERAARLAV